MKLVTTEFKSERLHEKHVVATWNLGNHLSFFLLQSTVFTQQLIISFSFTTG